MTDEPIPTRVEIHNDKVAAWGASIKVGGHLIPAERVVLELDAREVATLTVTMPITHGLDVGLEHADILLDDRTHEVLLALGWLPPEQTAMVRQLVEELVTDDDEDRKRRILDHLSRR